MSDEQINGAEKNKSSLIVQNDSPMAAFMDTGLFEQIQRAGRLLAACDIVPDSFRNKPADCAVACAMAMRLSIDVIYLMTKIYIVHGRPAIEAQFKIGMVNIRGPFDGPIDWEVGGEGDKRYWTAFATLKNNGRRVSYTVPWSMVEAEGWHRPRGRDPNKQQISKWVTMPDKMGRYRSASYLIDLYCPEIMSGMPMIDEIIDMAREYEVKGERIDMPNAPQKAHEPINMSEAEAVKSVKEELKPIVKKYTSKKDIADDTKKPISPGSLAVIKTKMELGAISSDDIEAAFGVQPEALYEYQTMAIIRWLNDPSQAPEII
jgi:hypothetical protein